MSWWGTLIGGAFGFMLGGPLGALFGAAFGRSFDKGLERTGEALEPGAQERVQAAFFTATFAVMGHLAKADGKVSQDEIGMAENIMAQMALAPEQRKAAIALFNQGKEPDFDLPAVLDQFRRECHRRGTLIQMFIEIQTQATYADGHKHPAEQRVLLQICDALGYPRHAFEQLEAMLLGNNRYAGAHRQTAATQQTVLEDAYKLLQVTPDTTDAEVKRSYRRLMSQHHPDKLVAKGLPEEMVKIANEKTGEIRKAYETIREDRKA